MHLYDSNNKIQKFDSVKDILEEFYKTRTVYYNKRKKLLIDTLQSELDIISSKIKFINMVISKKVNLLNIPKKDLIEILKKNDLLILPDESPYDYLIRLPFYTFTKEKIDELKEDFDKKEKLLDQIKKKTIEKMWLEDLANLREMIKS